MDTIKPRKRETDFFENLASRMNMSVSRAVNWAIHQAAVLVSLCTQSQLLMWAGDTSVSHKDAVEPSVIGVNINGRSKRELDFICGEIDAAYYAKHKVRMPYGTYSPVYFRVIVQILLQQASNMTSNDAAMIANAAADAGIITAADAARVVATAVAAAGNSAPPAANNSAAGIS